MHANPKREAIDAAMTYKREKLVLKPEQETAISNFTLGKVNLLAASAF